MITGQYMVHMELHCFYNTESPVNRGETEYFKMAYAEVFEKQITLRHDVLYTVCVTANSARAKNTISKHPPIQTFMALMYETLGSLDIVKNTCVPIVSSVVIPSPTRPLNTMTIGGNGILQYIKIHFIINEILLCK